MSALDSELAALSTLAAQELRMKWQALRCGEPMTPASRDLLIREIAYKMQERAHGRLAPAVKRRLRALAKEFGANTATSLVSAPLLKPGTRLVREWRGKRTRSSYSKTASSTTVKIPVADPDRAADHRGAMVRATLLRFETSPP